MNTKLVLESQTRPNTYVCYS